MKCDSEHCEIEKATYCCHDEYVELFTERESSFISYEQVLSMLSPGGYIIADNTLWDGHVLEEPHHTDMQTT